MPALVRRAKPLLGTLVAIEASGPEAAQAIAAGFAAIARVHQRMSRFEPDSDIARLNAAPVGTWAPVDASTATVLALAHALHRDSGGAFDCTRHALEAPLPSRERGWGEGAMTTGATLLPRGSRQRQLSSGPSKPGQADLEPRPSAPTPSPEREGGSGNAHLASSEPAWDMAQLQVRKRAPLRFDLGGIAKGYAVDQAIEAMRPFIAPHAAYALVNAGGDLRHLGAPAVRVALRDSADPARIARYLPLRDAAIASSAVGGLSPGEGAPRIFSAAPLPLQAGASVLAPCCMLADALTKVVLALRAPAHPLLARHGAQTLLYADG
jgi:thiamine biosynthesis lipoprotein